ncbi:glutathione S-transferase family protein [Paraburkholderia sp. RL17-347-BIC-D]|uniref:glutathione S-transferase family protein n=1 Tax=Paraburkholderia sp. RL17-347-BIC-D TaxID=3031632 RepID=UPI0038BC517A
MEFWSNVPVRVSDGTTSGAKRGVFVGMDGMGQLINGRWVADVSVLRQEQGGLVRQPPKFRNWVRADRSPEFPSRAGRYHLYVSLRCQWAWHTIVYRSVKKLSSVISMSVAIPNGGGDGWVFGDTMDGSTTDDVEGFTHLHQAYTCAKPDYTGVVSVPVLWDRRRRTIVNNESGEIIRMLNNEFNHFTSAQQDYYPPPLRPRIDGMNDRIYLGLNNAVYRAGAAESQEVYNEACSDIFDTLDWAEQRLSSSRYLAAAEITETDWRLAASLFLFELVYYPLFRCNKRTIASYPNLSNYLRDIYQTPGVAGTVHARQIIRGYYSQKWTAAGIIPLEPQGFEAGLAAPHDRSITFFS